MVQMHWYINNSTPASEKEQHHNIAGEPNPENKWSPYQAIKEL